MIVDRRFVLTGMTASLVMPPSALPLSVEPSGKWRIVGEQSRDRRAFHWRAMEKLSKHNEANVVYIMFDYDGKRDHHIIKGDTFLPVESIFGTVMDKWVIYHNVDFRPYTVFDVVPGSPQSLNWV